MRVIGCSPAWPNPGGAHSGYLVEDGGQRLLLDCGPGVLARLRRDEDWPRVDAIVISHFHLDHWGDLLPWTFGGRFGPGRAAVAPELWLQPGGADALQRLDSALSTTAVVDLFDVREYAAETPFSVAGFEVVAHPVHHYDIESYGIRVSAGGRTLAYSADSAPCAGLLAVARDADVFLCEATLADAENGLRGHLTAAEAIEASEAAGARRLVVIHRPSEFTLPDGVERAYDGLKLDV